MRYSDQKKTVRGARAAMIIVGLLAPLGGLAVASSAGAAATAVPLGSAGAFSVLAGSTVTNTGASVLGSSLGLSPGTSVTGFPPGIVNGSTDVADAVASQAQTDLVAAYNTAASEGPTSPIVADLGGQTLTPGVYNSASSIGLTGALTLDAGGNPDAVFVFQANTSTLTTATASQINLINGAQSCNVFWQVGSSATLGSASSFDGTIMAMQSITVTTGVTIQGRVLARNGAVTLDSDTISTPACTTSTATTTTTTTPTTVVTVATPGTTPTPTTPTPASTVAPAPTAVAKAAAAAAAAAAAKATKKAAGAAAATTSVPAASTVPVAPKSPIGPSPVSVTG